MHTKSAPASRCQMAIKAPTALLDEFKTACRQAGVTPTATVRSFMNDYLARVGEAPVVPDRYRIRHAVSRDLLAYTLAALEQGPTYSLRRVICDMLKLDEVATEDSTSAEYRRYISARRQALEDLPALVQHGLEVWTMDYELRRIEPGHADRHLSVRLAQYAELEHTTQRWIKHLLTGDAGRSVSLTESVMAMLELPADARKAFGSTAYHQLTRVRAGVRKDKRGLALLGITLSGRADDVVGISRMAKGGR